MKLGVAFDFDGVLYDTYWFMPSLLAELATALRLPPEILQHLEDIAEYLGAWDRRRAYSVFNLPPLIHDVIWVSRVALGRPTGVVDLLWKLRGLGVKLYIVCGADATRDEKMRRVEAYGVNMLVDRVVVYEPGGLRDALKNLVEDEHLDKLIYVDDKPGNTCIASSVERVESIRFAYRPPYPRGYAWSGYSCGERVATPEELLQAILDLIARR
ncbi:hypothetical protein [Pyrolobus fumarii]|uniref:hypothetical protein n=1 Tax=Pyrolobus fumarii TaxID=54252 RepID=UPI00064EAAC2|nr:hypothetical protein [Pyrolobus fumarii]